MADFVDVLRQFNRMCKANAGCSNCPLHEQDGVSDRCSIGAFVNDSERIEREVMKWAAEHPEPVYPTWEEWLQSVDVMESAEHIKNRCQCELLIDGIVAHAIPTRKVLEPIPADIAQKLGLQPKEG